MREGYILTIGEYLKQYEYLKGRADLTHIQLIAAEDKAQNIRCGLNIDGTPRPKGGRPAGNEKALIEAADALKAAMQADKEFKAYTKQLKSALNSLLYWEGRLISQIYINNVIFEHPPYYDIDYILEDMDKRPVNEYLSIAQGHLTDILTAQGVEITA